MDGCVRAWLERHGRIIGRALLQFFAVFMVACVRYRPATLAFG